MTTADLAFGRAVVWRSLSAVIVDIHWTRRTLVQIRVAGGHTHWTTPAELTACDLVTTSVPAMQAQAAASSVPAMSAGIATSDERIPQ